MRVGIAMEAEEVRLREGPGGGRGGERGPVGVLVGVEEDVCAVVFIVTGADVVSKGGPWMGGPGGAYSLAQRYGTRARMFGRAQVSRLKAVILGGCTAAGTQCSSLGSSTREFVASEQLRRICGEKEEDA